MCLQNLLSAIGLGGPSAEDLLAQSQQQAAQAAKAAQDQQQAALEKANTTDVNIAIANAASELKKRQVTGVFGTNYTPPAL